jgi:peptidyl-prolyl cis-trans isomerase C
MKYLLLLLGAAAAWGQQTPPPADPVVITIGSEKITKSQFEQIIQSLPAQQQQMVQTPAGRRQLAEQLAEVKTLAQEARVRKLDQSTKVQTQIKLQTDNLLAGMLFQDLGNTTKPDDAALHAYYDEHKAEWEQVTARHILIRFKGSSVPLKPDQKDLTDDEALAKVKDLRAKLVAGGEFAAVARAESDDTGTGQFGGELGSFAKGQMVPEFDTVAFTLEAGKVSEPVKTQFGYHLIMVDSHATKSFEDTRAEIATKMKPEMAQKGLEALKQKTKVVLDDTYFEK